MSSASSSASSTSGPGKTPPAPSTPEIFVRPDGLVNYRGKTYRMVWHTADGSQSVALQNQKLTKDVVDLITSINQDPATPLPSLDKIKIHQASITGVNIQTPLKTETLETISGIYEKASQESSALFAQQPAPPPLISPETVPSPPLSDVKPTVRAKLPPVVPPHSEARLFTPDEQFESMQTQAIQMLQSRMSALEEMLPAWGGVSFDYMLDKKKQIPPSDRYNFITNRMEVDTEDLKKLPDEIRNSVQTVPPKGIKEKIKYKLGLSELKEVSHADTIGQIHSKIADLANLYALDSSRKDLHDKIMDVIIQINQLESALLRDVEAGIKKGIHASYEESCRRIDNSVGQGVLNADEAKELKATLKPPHDLVLHLRNQLTKTEGWWNEISSTLPFHAGDRCTMTPVSQLYGEGTYIPEDINYDMVPSGERKNKNIKGAVNQWKVTYDIGGERYDFIRSAAWETPSRAKQLFHVATAQYFENHPEKLEAYLNAPEANRKPLVIPLTTMSLLTMRSGEEKMWDDQMKACDALTAKSVSLPFRLPDGSVKLVQVKLEVAAYNFAVAEDRHFVFGDKQEVHNRTVFENFTMKRYQNFLKEMEGPGGKIKMAKTEAERKALQEKVVKVKMLMDQIQKGFEDKSLDPFVIPARLIIVGKLIGGESLFNCKSGKDRTGLLETEERHLLLQLKRWDELRAEGKFDEASKLMPLDLTLEDAEAKFTREILLTDGTNGELCRKTVNRTGLKTLNKKKYRANCKRIDNPKVRLVASGNEGEVHS